MILDCPACGKTLAVSEKHLGTVRPCPACGAGVQLPSDAGGRATTGQLPVPGPPTPPRDRAAAPPPAAAPSPRRVEPRRAPIPPAPAAPRPGVVPLLPRAGAPPDPSRPAPREGPSDRPQGVFIPLPLLLGGGAVLALGIVLVAVVGWKRSRAVSPPAAPPVPVAGDVVDGSGTPLPPVRIPSTGTRTRLAALQEVDQGRVLLVAALKSWIASPDDGAKVRAAWLGWSDAIDRARGLPTAAPGSEEEVDRAYRVWLDAVSALRTAMRSVVEKAEAGNPVAVVSRYDEVLAAQDVAVGAARTELDLLLPPGSR